MEKHIPVGVGEAVQQIGAIEGMIAQMGANDSEFASIETIRKQLAAGDITPADAVTQAESVRDSKQAYH